MAQIAESALAVTMIHQQANLVLTHAPQPCTSVCIFNHCRQESRQTTRWAATSNKLAPEAVHLARVRVVINLPQLPAASSLDCTQPQAGEGRKNTESTGQYAGGSAESAPSGHVFHERCHTLGRNWIPYTCLPNKSQDAAQMEPGLLIPFSGSLARPRTQSGVDTAARNCTATAQDYCTWHTHACCSDPVLRSNADSAINRGSTHKLTAIFSSWLVGHSGWSARLIAPHTSNVCSGTGRSKTYDFICKHRHRGSSSMPLPGTPLGGDHPGPQARRQADPNQPYGEAARPGPSQSAETSIERPATSMTASHAEHLRMGDQTDSDVEDPEVALDSLPPALPCRTKLRVPIHVDGAA